MIQFKSKCRKNTINHRSRGRDKKKHYPTDSGRLRKKAAEFNRLKNSRGSVNEAIRHLLGTAYSFGRYLKFSLIAKTKKGEFLLFFHELQICHDLRR